MSTHRLQLDFKQEAYDQLQEIRQECNFGTDAETIRAGVRLLSFFNKNFKKDDKMLEIPVYNEEEQMVRLLQIML